MENEESNRTNVLKGNYESRLGTLEHWNAAYAQEIEQFNNNNHEVGDIWFGTELQKKLVNYIDNHYENRNVKIFDVGFGNGIFLYKLAKKGFINLYGIDYSPDSIKLAELIIKNKEAKHNKKYNINLICEDINNKTNIFKDKFDIIHDKGSFDAFMMNKKNNIEKYYEYIKSYSKLDKSTLFIITSCNNTREELHSKFPEEKGFKFIEEIKNKTFSFGGSEGQQFATQIYKIINI